MISEYLSDVMRAINLQDGDAWALADFSEKKVKWGKMTGLDEDSKGGAKGGGRGSWKKKETGGGDGK